MFTAQIRQLTISATKILLSSTRSPTGNLFASNSHSWNSPSRSIGSVGDVRWSVIYVDGDRVRSTAVDALTCECQNNNNSQVTHLGSARQRIHCFLATLDSFFWPAFFGSGDFRARLLLLFINLMLKDANRGSGTCFPSRRAIQLSLNLMNRGQSTNNVRCWSLHHPLQLGKVMGSYFMGWKYTGHVQDPVVPRCEHKTEVDWPPHLPHQKKVHTIFSSTSERADRLDIQVAGRFACSYQKVQQ